jgi:ketosteroid isomerase-like protein
MSSSLHHLFAITAMVCTFSAAGFSAGNNATEEAAIRKRIAAADNSSMPPPRTSDPVFWSGAYKKPIIGKEKGESTSDEKRVPGSQKVRTEPLRIVVAYNRDLAYEYSKFTLEFTTEAGKHVKFDGGLLRVSQKESGEWKQAAAFMRPDVE